jgi:hypothetical protein
MTPRLTRASRYRHARERWLGYKSFRTCSAHANCPTCSVGLAGLDTRLADLGTCVGVAGIQSDTAKVMKEQAHLTKQSTTFARAAVAAYRPPLLPGGWRPVGVFFFAVLVPAILVFAVRISIHVVIRVFVRVGLWFILRKRISLAQCEQRPSERTVRASHAILSSCSFSTSPSSQTMTRSAASPAAKRLPRF